MLETMTQCVYNHRFHAADCRGEGSNVETPCEDAETEQPQQVHEGSEDVLWKQLRTPIIWEILFFVNNSLLSNN